MRSIEWWGWHQPSSRIGVGAHGWKTPWKWQMLGGDKMSGARYASSVKELNNPIAISSSPSRSHYLALRARPSDLWRMRTII